MRHYVAIQIYKHAMILNASYDIELGCMYFENNNMKGILQLYPEGWLEVTIKDESDEIKFYQQLDTNEDQEDALFEILQSFYEYMYENKVKDTLKEDHYNRYRINNHKENFKIIVTCTSGASSSYYASILEENLKKLGVNLVVGAIDYTSLDEVQQNYDLILLSPQVSYKLMEYKEKYGNKVIKIHARDYATLNTKWIEEQLKG